MPERIVLRSPLRCSRRAACWQDPIQRSRPQLCAGAMVIVSGAWSTTGVNALLAGLIGVAATLLGSFTTYLFQSRTAERAQSFERDERLRYEQLNACSAFASALTETQARAHNPVVPPRRRTRSRLPDGPHRGRPPGSQCRSGPVPGTARPGRS